MACCCSCTPPEPVALEVGRVASGRLEAGSSRAFLLDAPESSFVEVSVEQLGVDLVMILRDPAGEEIARVDSPIDFHGAERGVLVTESGGVHELELTALEGSGRFHLTLEQLRPAGEHERRRAEAHRVFRAGEVARGDGRLEAALEAHRQALRLAPPATDGWLETEAHERIGRVLLAAGRPREALAPLRAALEDFRRPPQPRRVMICLDLIGRAHFRLGETETAARHFRQALGLAHAAGNRRGRALLLVNLGLVLQRRGEVAAALGSLEQGLKLWVQLGEDDSAATTRVHLGRLYVEAGDDQRARDVLEEALAALDEGEAGPDEAVSRAQVLDLLGELEKRRGDYGAALESFHAALDLRRGEAQEAARLGSLSRLARLYRERGQLETALTMQRRLLAAYEARDDLHGVVRTLRNLGRVEEDLGRLDAAESRFARALEIYRQLEEPTGLADVQVELSDLARRLGHLDLARQRLEAALEIYDGLRLETPGAVLRRSYTAGVDRFFDAYVDLLMTLHGERPDGGFEALAFVAAESARARELLEVVGHGRRRVEDEADERGLLLRSEIEVLASHRGHDAAIERRLRALRERLSRLQDEMESVGSMSEDLSRPLDARGMRRLVASDDRRLLLYFLGPSRSFLWLLGSDRLVSYELAPRQVIEEQARRASRFLVASRTPEGGPAARRALCELGRLVLQPAAEELAAMAGGRLLVVGDGALLAVPFAAVPVDLGGGASSDPCEGGEALVRRFELVQGPSASVLAALGRRVASSAETPSTDDPSGSAGKPLKVAIVADPIFGEQDPRAGSRAETRSTSAGDLRRLPHAAGEAAAVLAAAGLADAEVLVATGLEADEDLVGGGRLAGAHVVHFATHGLLDADHPELSSLALTPTGAPDRPGDGLLRAYEISRLELRASLVTLSACRTALGREVRGEGLVGLAQAFFDAGAGSLLVSLWDVEDAATAELMTVFYRQLFGRGLEPAEALRRAQLALAEDPRYAAPFYWSAFVLQGEGHAVSSGIRDLESSPFEGEGR